MNKGSLLRGAVLVVDTAAAQEVPGLWATGFVLKRHGSGMGDASSLPEPSLCMPEGVDLDSLKDHPTAAAYRKLSWQVGIDPTKNRPAGEALARRVLQGKKFPQIHPLVDAYNRGSARTLVPLGAYDLDRLRPPVTVRLARDGETFHGIARDPEPLEAGRIVYADATDRVCGVFLWRDGHETRVREDSKRVLVTAVGGDPLSIQTGLAALSVVAGLAQLVGWVPEDPPEAEDRPDA